jgi:ribosome maturation factor RimP
LLSRPPAPLNFELFVTGRPRIVHKEEVITRLEGLIQPYLAAQGVELVEVEFTQPRRGRATLRLFVDRDGGITLDEIARVSRVVGELLDVHDLISSSYTLEVGLRTLYRAPGAPHHPGYLGGQTGAPGHFKGIGKRGSQPG